MPDRPPDAAQIARVQQHARYDRMSPLRATFRPDRAGGERHDGDNRAREEEPQQQEKQGIGEIGRIARDDPARGPQKDETKGCDLA